jgi:hypothetical protein
MSLVGWNRIVFCEKRLRSPKQDFGKHPEVLFGTAEALEKVDLDMLCIIIVKLSFTPILNHPVARFSVALRVSGLLRSSETSCQDD